jgi:Zn-dependent peptidase ImmA (M78 family)/DNA-binding Xre family transcriptional regulator
MQKLQDILTSSSLSAEQIADKSGIAEERITRILNGTDPTISELRKIAAALKINLTDFVPQSSSQHDLRLKFRQGLARHDEPSIKHAAALENKIASTIELIGLNRSPKRWAQNFNVEKFDYANAERAARQFRDTFFDKDNHSPFGSLPKVCIEKLGVLLFVSRESDFEGASTVLGGYPFIFIAARSFEPRMLFTLAHEIGHLVANKCTENHSVIDMKSDIENWSEKSGEEAFADAFASCLLMPSEGVGLTLKKIREFIRQGDVGVVGDVEILYLARIYNVSFMAAAIRCERLGLIPPGAAFALNEIICKQHVSPEQRANTLGLPPRAKIAFPELSKKLLGEVTERIHAGHISIGRASSLLGVSILDLFRLNEDTLH